MRVVLLALTLLWSMVVHASGNLPVFVLHSYSQEYPWTQRQHSGFLTALSTAGISVTASVEYLDTKRVTYDIEYAAQMAQHLAWKYRGYQPKAIYVTDDNALSFATAHLLRLFPQAPVFFSGVNNYQSQAQFDPQRVTGVFDTLKAIAKLVIMELKKGQEGG